MSPRAAAKRQTTAPAEFAPIRVEPAYRKVAAALLERITDRSISAGDRLPPEIELARQFGVHRGTVREALRELETNGVLKRERGSKLMMVTRPARVTVAAGVSRALALHDVSYHDVWEALTALEPPIAAAAARHRTAADIERLEAVVRRAGRWPSSRPRSSSAPSARPRTTACSCWRTSRWCSCWSPSCGAMIDKVPQAAARIATAQKRIVAAIRERDGAQQAEDWMAKHIRDFRRGFEIAGIGLEQRVGNTRYETYRPDAPAVGEFLHSAAQRPDDVWLESRHEHAQAA